MKKTELIPILRALQNPFWNLNKDQVDTLLKWPEENTPELSSHIHETKNGFLASFDMPGVSIDDIRIECRGHHVAIEATRKMHTKDGQTTTVSYSQKFSIPDDVDKEKVEAHYENGVLQLVFPKSTVEKTNKIPVKTGQRSKNWLQFLNLSSTKDEEKDHPSH